MSVDLGAQRARGNIRDGVQREIRRALALLCEPGDVNELRVPNAGRGGTISGYYDDPDALVRDALHLDGRRDLPGIYITANPVNRALLARAVNRIVERAKHTTSDADIVRRRWLLVDLDPLRPAGVSSTDAQHDAALTLARGAREWLVELGIPRESIVLADSGNGAHLLVCISLLNDAAAAELCKRCLAALDLFLSTDVVHVDLTTFNAARIWKVYGTTARKGDPTFDQPHRRARLIDVPEPLVTAPREALETLAARAPREPERREYQNRGGRAIEVVGAWLAEQSIEVARTRPWQGGMLYELTACPFAADDHGTDRAAYVIQHASGAVSAHRRLCRSLYSY